MKKKLPKILIKLHSIALAVAILNSLFNYFTAFSLASEIEFGIKIGIASSGLILFFLYLRQFKKMNTYFSVYAIAGILFTIGLIFRGIFGALIITLMLFPIMPNEKEFENNGIIISIPFQGFIASCCSYQLKERQLILFERDYGTFELEGEGPINFETMRINQSETEIVLTYSTDFDKGIVKTKIIKR
jgi:hypothetical protein